MSPEFRERLQSAIPTLVAAVSMALFGAAALWRAEDIRGEARVEIKFISERLSVELTRRLQVPVYGLNGARGVFAHSDQIGRAEFRSYVESRDLPREFPGVLGFSFNQHVLPSELDAFVRQTRADGAPGFTVRQLADKTQSELYIVKFIEPMASNSGALGLDIGSDPLRRPAIQQAIDSGNPAMSAPISLVQSQRPSLGALLMVPIYAKGTHPATPSERRAAARGVLGAPILHELMLSGMPDVTHGLVNFELFDTTDGVGDGTLIFDSGMQRNTRAERGLQSFDSQFSVEKKISLMGREFTLHVKSDKGFHASLDHHSPWMIALFGLVVSGMFWLYLRRRWHEHAIVLAMVDERTADIQLAFKIAKLGRSLIDLITQKVVWDEGQFDILGVPAHERVNPVPLRKVFEFVHPDDRDRVQAVIDQLIRSGEDVTMEHRMIRPDGKTRDVQVIAHLLQDSQGKPARIVVVQKDITERKEAEGNLMRQRELMQSILDNIPIGLSAFDGELKMIAMNKEFQESLDFPDELFSGPVTTFESLIHFNADRGEYGVGDHTQVIRAIVERARHPQEHHFERQRPNGGVLEIRGSPLPEGGFVTTYSDISERKRAEDTEKKLTAQLRENEARFHDFSLSASDWFWETDSQHCLSYFSSGFENLFDLAPRQGIGKSILEVLGIALFNAAEIAASFHGTLNSRLAFKHFEFQRGFAKGNAIWISVAGVPYLNEDGGFAGYRGTGTLITERKANEESLREAMTVAQAASEAKTQFLANMSHEMRTPINAIVGVQQILARTPLSEDQRSFLAASTSSAQSLLALVNDILDMSKIEVGKLDIVESAFAITDITEALVTMLQPTADAKHLNLLLEIEPEVPPVLLGDSMRLRQVLLNLGSNAVKFTESGEVRISLEVIGRSEQNVQLRFAVKDTGIGIPPEKHAHIFGAFNQADSTTTRQYGGTGLGLSISRALVKAMGGALELRSEVGKGSTFSFDMRLAVAPDDAILERPAAASATKASQSPQTDALSRPPAGTLRLQGLRVLVAEDQPINRKIVERMLVHEGASVELVDDGQKAVDAVKKAHQQGQLYDAVLMDMQMPELSGLEASREIRQVVGLGSGELPILALTANAMAIDVKSCLDAGMNGHIAKPVNIDELVRQLIACTAKA